MLEFILERGNYWAIIGLMMIGLYTLFAATNLIKRLVGLSIFQTSIILFYISLSRIDGGTAPILYGKDAGGHGGGHADGRRGHGDGHGRAASFGCHGDSFGFGGKGPRNGGRRAGGRKWSGC